MIEDQRLVEIEEESGNHPVILPGAGEGGGCQLTGQRIQRDFQRWPQSLHRIRFAGGSVGKPKKSMVKR